MLGQKVSSLIHIVGVSGNFRRPSKTHALVAQVMETIKNRYGIDGQHLELSDALPDLGLTFEREMLRNGLAELVTAIETADVLVVGSPVYKGSYSGLFKHLFDLIDPLALCGKPVIITAAGGGDRHALVVEQAMRPLFGFFTAHAMPTAIYASGSDFEDDRVISKAVLNRIDDAVSQLAPLIGMACAPRAPRDAHSSDENILLDASWAFDRFFS